MGTASVKFEIIQETLLKEDNDLSVSYLCKVAGVSRSGYYRWLKSEDARRIRDEQDQADFERILKAYHYRGYKKGARSIYMRLLHQEPPVRMNVKKIRRLMDKFGLFCPIRKANPYRHLMKSVRTNQAVENLPNPEFTEPGVRKIFLTDITCIPYNGTFCYLSTVLDVFTRQVLSYVISDSREVDFVLETVNQLIERHGVSLSTETLIHSDQSSHYTSCRFIQIVKDPQLRQSMSRRGICWDNAPPESFFRYMKDEIDLSMCQNFLDIKAVIDDWIDYYNNDRYQWQLAKLSPNEYYQYLTTGEYPLKLDSFCTP